MHRRFATFNLRYDTPDDGDRSWEHRTEAVRATIRDLDPSVLAVQEARPNQYSDLEAWFDRYEWVGTCRRGDGTGEHVAIGYDRRHCDCLASGGFWLSETPTYASTGWDAACPRVATWARLSFGGQPVHVVATHLDHAGANARRNGAELLSRHLSAQSVPTVLMGDLNATPTDPAVAALTNGPLAPARERADAVSGPADTFHGFGTGPTERIDYVLVSERLDVHEAGTVDSAPPYPSDHNPVYADLSIRDVSDERSSA